MIQDKTSPIPGKCRAIKLKWDRWLQCPNLELESFVCNKLLSTSVWIFQDWSRYVSQCPFQSTIDQMSRTAPKVTICNEIQYSFILILDLWERDMERKVCDYHEAPFTGDIEKRKALRSKIVLSISIPSFGIFPESRNSSLPAFAISRICYMPSPRQLFAPLEHPLK